MLPHILFLAASLSATGASRSPAVWLSLADEFRAPGGTLSFQVEVKDFLKSQLLRENTYRVYSKEDHSVLVETLAPTRLIGRKLLMAGTLWMYLPSLKRPTQVSLQSRLTGEVSNGDIARMQFSRDYAARVESVNKSGARLWLTARLRTATYRNIRLHLAPDGMPTKAEYFAISGKLLKTGEYSGLQPVLGRKRLTRVTIRDAIDPNKQSFLTYSKYRNEVLDDAFFDKENLVD